MSKWILILWLAGLCLDAAAARILHEERSLYSRIVVLERGDIVCLQFNIRRDQRNQSCMNKRRPKEMVFAYTRMSMAGLLFNPQPRNVLVVGLGGGTVPTALHQLFPNANIDSIEVDAAVLDVAERYFGFLANDKLRAYVSDARVWVKRATQRKRRYDFVLLDAFNGEYIPEHLMTQEFLQEVRAIMTDDGLLLANTFSISDLYHHESATYAKVFGGFIDFQVSESANRVIVVPGTQITDAKLHERALMLKPLLAPYDVPIQRYARLIEKLRRKPPGWRQDARPLSDQFSPANLLQGR